MAESSTARTESLRASSSAGQTEQIDTAVWLAWLDAVGGKDTRRAEFLEARFRPALAAAHDNWVEKAVVAPDGTITAVPPGTPFGEPEYVVPAQEQADALSAEAEGLLARSQKNASTSTKFVTNALVLALVLFFAGIATKFRNPKIQALLVLLAIVLGTFGLVRMLMLPQLL